jgi:hypothetical protein
MPVKVPKHTPASHSKAADIILKLSESTRRGELVAVTGSGVSVGLTNASNPALSWKGLILDGFAYGVRKGKISLVQETSWRAQIESTDIDELLGAAEFMGRKLEAPNGDLYARWLESVFKNIRPQNKAMQRAILALATAGIPLCTLNYDTLVEQTTGFTSVNMTDTVRVLAWMRREIQGVFHLHGVWESPATCVLGIRDYEATLGNDVRDMIQRSLGSFKRLLFIRCGDTFGDPNFSALIRWLRQNTKSAAPEHYALVTEDDVPNRDSDPSWHGFVEPLSYGTLHAELPHFLLTAFRSKSSSIKRKPAVVKTAANSPTHAILLEDYRAFLLKDCGQMTIEGVRADRDTAQRRFDLERLFVPLKVLPTPPDLPDTDPNRERKLHEWHQKHKEPLPFGAVFETRKRLALLALPGGGKTLLLKRLAVAYADTSRRNSSPDGLPDLDVMPVLIRCREWREHIHRPILTLLQSLPEITGQVSLAGLSKALVPLFSKGRVLLLVDGLDEIHDDALRTTFVEHLEAFLAEFKLTRLVVTSREAGFGLVAPSLARFCERWRIAPLEPDTIRTLCGHWHLLMMGDAPEQQIEAQQVAEHLLRNESLRRLAENPLLLTMLLVVKHGAGRLPPDRVSLYSRATEVLLDTWNIKGHDPLNLKEAVPQLACVAFELMRAGKQTATERELLALLEEARERVPQIRRYAKDTPQEFLRRVELRSSLVVEGGRQADKNGTVPFYQFRHLTFQEYLAAVAVVEGHYMEYQKGDTVLTPLRKYLTSEEWKEVVPMSAVLARKQAEPIMGALVEMATGMREDMETKARSKLDLQDTGDWPGIDGPPPPVARLVQCLSEEAEAAPETLTAALQLTAFFGGQCTPRLDWAALSRGPYGEEALHQAWATYAPMQWPRESCLDDYISKLTVLSHPIAYWDSMIAMEGLQVSLSSSNPEDIGRGLLTCAGLLWPTGEPEYEEMLRNRALRLPFDVIESYIFHDDMALYSAAAWAWGWIYQRLGYPARELTEVLDRLSSLYLADTHPACRLNAGIALKCLTQLPRGKWRAKLNPEQKRRIQQSPEFHGGPRNFIPMVTALMIAFHAEDWDENDYLAEQLAHASTMRDLANSEYGKAISQMLEDLGETGKRYLEIEMQRTQKSKRKRKLLTS